MLKNRLKLMYIFSFISIIILSTVCFYAGRLPTAVVAFKESISEERSLKQLFKAYNVMDGTFYFELPDSWFTNEVSFMGGEILYHMDFISPDKKIYGFVQVWKLSEPLRQFIEKSKESAVGVLDFKYFDIKEIMSDNKRGYMLDYSRANYEGGYIKAYETFIEGYADRIYRISFFVPEKEWKNYYKVIFDRIIHTIKIRK